MTRSPVIWGLFALTILVGAGFVMLAPAVGGQYLDTVSSGERARALMDGLSADERSAHFWTTVLLDTAYPLAYGGFFAAMALRFLGKYGRIVALPALATIIVDLTENTAQALALSGAADVLDAKAWLTPLKFGLFFLSAGIALIAALVALIHIFRKRTA